MRNNVRTYIVFSVMLILLLGVTSCKRSAPADPNEIPNAGYRIILSGTANPSTVYVPEAQPATSTTISVRALKNDGTAAAGYTIVFEDYFGYGYFDGYKVSDTKVTDSNGNASIVYFIPPAASVKATVTGQIKATLVDDGRLDNLPLSDVYDVIPVRVIPYMNEGVIIHGHVMTPGGSGVGDVIMTLTGTEGYGSAVGVTRSSGSYEFYVPGGWYGTLEAAADGYIITPTSYEWTSASPVLSDLDGVDFVAVFESGSTLATDITTLALGVSGGSQAINVFNSTGDSAISYTIAKDVSWVHLSSSSGTTPGSFTITVDPNDSGVTRTCEITLNATSTNTSSCTIAISQLANEVSGDARLAADVSTINAENAGNAYTVNVYNSGTSDTIDFVVTCSDSWITADENTGTTDATITITIATNPNTSSRTGTVTLTPTTSGVTNTVVIDVTQGGSPTLVPDQSSLFLPRAGGDVTRVYLSASDGSSITFSVTQGLSWLTISPDSGTTATSNNYINIETEWNNTGSNRAGTIIISSPSAPSVSLPVTQSGT